MLSGFQKRFYLNQSFEWFCHFINDRGFKKMDSGRVMVFMISKIFTTGHMNWQIAVSCFSWMLG